MKNTVRILALILLLGGAAAAGYAQAGPFSTDIGGSPYKDDSQRAADHYARGIRFKGKAEKENAPDKQAKLYEKAREELVKSIGLDSSYDALLALGQVYLRLGNAFSSLEACSQALQFRPHDEAASTCVSDAKKAGARAGL